MSTDQTSERKPDIEELGTTMRAACDAIDDLTVSLGPFEGIVPQVFPKPLAEMGSSDKMRTAYAIVELTKAIWESTR